MAETKDKKEKKNTTTTRKTTTAKSDKEKKITKKDTSSNKLKKAPESKSKTVSSTTKKSQPTKTVTTKRPNSTTASTVKSKKPTTASTTQSQKSATAGTAKSKKSATTSTTKSKKSATASTAKSKKSATTSTTQSKKSTPTSARQRKTTSTTGSSKIEKSEVVYEYYDLPYRYNDTIVKILAQTPHSIFIYWDIADSDRQNMINTYGENFFYETKPILLVHNHTLNTTFEIEIDDFTNSWYFKTPTSNCVYTVELGRRKKSDNTNINFYDNSNILHIAKSNTIESPNDHVLNNLPREISFQNVKTKEYTRKFIQDQESLDKLYASMEFTNGGLSHDNMPSSDFMFF